MRRRLRSPAVRAGLCVGAVVLVASVVWGLEVRGVSNWTTMTDELHFVRLGEAIWSSHSALPRIRGVDVGFYSQLYPLLLAPVYGPFGTPAAFDLAHYLNVVLMASTAVPAYLLSREVVESRVAGVIAAALCVVVPWIGLASLLRSEAVAYPAFVWAALAMQRAVAEPGAGRDVVALIAIGIAIFARTQFVVLLAAFPAVVVVHQVGYALATRAAPRWYGAVWTGLRRSVAAHPIWAVLVAVALPLLALGLLDSLLGVYQNSLEDSLLPRGTASSAVRHLAIIAVAIGILPMVLGLAWGLVTLVRPAARREHAFVALTAVVATLVVLQASSFAVTHTLVSPDDPQDRYFFYFVPLLLVGMVACILDRRRVPIAVAVGLAAPVIALLISGAEFALESGTLDRSPATALYPTLLFRITQVGDWVSIGGLTIANVMPWVALVTGIAAAAALRYARPRRLLAAIGVLLIAFGVAQTHLVFRAAKAGEQRPERPAGSSPRDDWIDAALDDDAEAAMIPSPSVGPGAREPFTAPVLWWHTEFWNKRVTSAYVVPGHLDYASFRNGQVIPDWQTGEVLASNSTPPPRYLVVSDTRFDFMPRGRAVASSPYGLRLIDAGEGHRYRAAWATRGLTGLGWTRPAKPVTLRVYRDRSRTARVRLTLEAPPGMRSARPFSVGSGRASARGRVAADRRNDSPDERGFARAQETRTVELCLPRGRRDARIRVSGATRLESSGEAVGLRLTRVELPPGRC